MTGTPDRLHVRRATASAYCFVWVAIVHCRSRNRRRSPGTPACACTLATCRVSLTASFVRGAPSVEGGLIRYVTPNITRARHARERDAVAERSLPLRLRVVALGLELVAELFEPAPLESDVERRRPFRAFIDRRCHRCRAWPGQPARPTARGRPAPPTFAAGTRCRGELVRIVEGVAEIHPACPPNISPSVHDQCGQLKRP